MNFPKKICIMLYIDSCCNVRFRSHHTALNPRVIETCSVMLTACIDWLDIMTLSRDHQEP